MGPTYRGHSGFDPWRALAHLVAILLTGLFFLVDIVPLPFLGSAAIRPEFFIMVIYFWAIFNPLMLSPLVLFILGLVIDALAGLPLGMHAFFYLLVYFIIRQQRRFLLGQSFFILWIVYILLNVGVQLSEWLLFSLTRQGWLPLNDFFFSALIGICFFPCLCWIFSLMHRWLNSAD